MDKGSAARHQALYEASSCEQQSRLHARSGFVTPHATRAHFHFANCLLGGIIGPRDQGFGLKGTVGMPILAQTQLFQGRTGLVSFGTTTWQLFPDGIEGLTAIGKQKVDERMNFLQDPEPFLGNGFLQGFTDPASELELTELMPELQVFRHQFVTG
jgi:hypothetical protein